MPNPYESTITIDVMQVVKSTANSISKDTNIFYDTELLAIIHRSKSKSSGLVSTKVWSWQGKRNQRGEKEERKLQDLAKRYGTTLVSSCFASNPSVRPIIVQCIGNCTSVPRTIGTCATSWRNVCHPTGKKGPNYFSCPYSEMHRASVHTGHLRTQRCIL
jgi:hypothetical protein